MIQNVMRQVQRLAVILLFTSPNIGNAITNTEPPESMVQWKEWLVAGFPKCRCPYLGLSAASKKCAWPSQEQIWHTDKPIPE